MPSQAKPGLVLCYGNCTAPHGTARHGTDGSQRRQMSRADSGRFCWTWRGVRFGPLRDDWRPPPHYQWREQVIPTRRGLADNGYYRGPTTDKTTPKTSMRPDLVKVIQLALEVSPGG
jgi:hypothetical protein